MAENYQASEILAELKRRGALKGGRSDTFEMAEIRAELHRRGALPEPHPDLVGILADLGQRYTATLEDLDRTVAEAEALKAAVPEPGVLMARVVEALAQAVEGMTASLTAQAAAQAVAKPTVRTVLRDAEGNISQIIDEQL